MVCLPTGSQLVLKLADRFVNVSYFGKVHLWTIRNNRLDFEAVYKARNVSFHFGPGTD